MANENGIVYRYIGLGLSLGRHIDGLVDAYYGPPILRDLAENGPLKSPSEIADEARRVLVDIDSGYPLDDQSETGRYGPSGWLEGISLEPAPASAEVVRRHWLKAQTVGLLTTARKLCGEPISYSEEVQLCYGVKPQRVPEDEIFSAHSALGEVLPGSGNLMERREKWINDQAVEPGKLMRALSSLRDDLRDRTLSIFGLPETESVEFELVTGKPWSGFNYYLGELRSKVAINTDLPVLSTSLAHLVAHESYPGHHTEHCHKEVGLVRRHRLFEETIFLVGTPQCLISEGLADLGLEVLIGRHPEQWVQSHLKPLGITYDPEVVERLSDASEILGRVRSNAAFRLHEDGADPDTVVAEVSRQALLPTKRAEKMVEFLTDPTWRAYISCYVEGLPLCRKFVNSDALRFARLLEEQLTPGDLESAA